MPWVGCKKQEITVYRVPKEERTTIVSSNAESAPSSPTEKIQWVVPSGWQQQTASAMRYASFLVVGKNGKQADMSVAVFPGDAGGILANVNRWRGQLNLPSVNESELGRLMEKLTENGREILIVNMAGPKPQDNKSGSPPRLLGAILHHNDQSWFFKMMGDDSVVTEQKASFLAFLKSVQFPTNTTHLVESKTPAVAAVNPPSSPGKIRWKAPGTWKEQPSQGMRQGSFLIIGKDDRRVDVSIIALPGTAGGISPNIIMWRSQLALPQVSEEEMARSVSPTHVAGHPATLVELVSTTPVIDEKHRGRILVAVLPQDDQTWFFKMVGEDSLVSKEKRAFFEFLKSIRFSDDS